MPLVTPHFDPNTVAWRRVVDPGFARFSVDFEHCLLGWDLDAGRLDMLLRYTPGGHCRPHRHIAATATLVLEGEQFLEEVLPDGGTRRAHRRRGDYALAPADAHPHDEWGGPEGGTVLLSMTAPDGLLFEYFGESMRNGWTLSIRQYVEAWETGAVYGASPANAAAE